VKNVVFLSVALAAAGVALPAAAQNMSSFGDMPADAVRPTVASRMPCASIAGRVFPEVTLIQATAHEATAGLPAYCQVTGYISPAIRFEITLPDRWNRRLYMFGNGGWAGENLADPSRIATRDAALSRGFMTVQQNSGHDAGTYRLGDFAHNNMDLLIDYASRAVHVTVNTAKAVAAAYYERGPSFSYWAGCSTGGRQGLMAAQRYPADFDGIVAGAPVLALTDTQIWGVHNAQALDKAPISVAQLPVLARAVMNKCDRIDGVEDGLIADPRKCDFDPAADLPADAGFTPEQVETLKALHEGVKVDGETVFPGIPWGVEGLTAQGESGWHLWLVSEDGPSRQLLYGETFLHNMLLLPKSGKDIDWRSFDIAANYKDTGLIRSIVDATNPDMSDFASRGGRILGYFGWSDPALNPMMNVNFYEQVRETMGEQETADFYRLFMVPGMFHCTSGYGTDQFDAVTPLIDWVERGIAPERITAKQSEPARSRPLCPYPQVAAYGGSGDVNDAANFSCAASD